MENILPSYHDPLFSILLIVFISLIITLVSYGLNLYNEQKEEGKLLKFLEKFDTSECGLDTKGMPFEKHMLKPLTLLAKAFENAGEYPKSINIYLYLIKHIDEKNGEIELMERLANTYLHAGFLERANSVYLEILRRMPRNISVLYELGIVYENMHRFEKALEIIEPLKVLGEKTESLENFLTLSQIKFAKDISKEEKIYALKQLTLKEKNLYRESISILFKLDHKEAWKIINPTHINEILDILWFLPNSQLDFDIISQHTVLRTLFYARGDLNEACIDSSIFTLNMIAIAKQNNYDHANLHFSYLCTKCKQHFPVSFTRCPNCMTIHSVKVEEYIAKSSPKTNYSLL